MELELRTIETTEVVISLSMVEAHELEAELDKLESEVGLDENSRLYKLYNELPSNR